MFGSYGTTVEKKRTLKCHFKYKEISAFCANNDSGLVAGWNHGFDDTGLQSGSGSCSVSDPCALIKRITDSCGNNMFPLAQFTNIFL